MKSSFVIYSTSIFLAVFLTFSSVRAQIVGEKTQKFIDELQLQSEKIQSLTSIFRQTKILSLFKDPVVFNGRFALQKPDKLLWEFTAPLPSSLIFNGDSGTRCIEKKPPEAFNLASDPIMKIIAGQMWGWLEGNYSRLGDKYAIELTAPETLTITPEDLETTKFIATVVITFDGELVQPQKVEITEPDGDMTIIEFSEYKLNPFLSPKIFTQCFSGA